MKTWIFRHNCDKKCEKTVISLTKIEMCDTMKRGVPEFSKNYHRRDKYERKNGKLEG